MGTMNLQSTLEPLLNEMWAAADERFRKDQSDVYDGNDPTQVKQAASALSTFNNDLMTLVNRFRSYYTLDEKDWGVEAEYFANSWDRWQSPTSSSTFARLARANTSLHEAHDLASTGDWAGQAAKGFNSFVDKFLATAAVHGGYAVELGAAYWALHLYVEATKQTLTGICKQLTSRLKGEAEGGESESFQGLSGIAAVVADAIALFGAVTASVVELPEVALAAVGVLGGILAESKWSHERSYEVDDNPFAVGLVRNAWYALDNVDASIADWDEANSNGLSQDFLKLSEEIPPLNGGNPDQPDLDPGSLRFKSAGAPAAPGEPTLLVQDLYRLFYVGYYTIPQAVAGYDAGLLACQDAAKVQAGNEPHFPKTMDQLNTATSILDELMRPVRERLSALAGSLVKAAGNYEQCSQDEIDQVEKLKKQVPAPGQAGYTPPSWLHPTK